MPSRGVLRASQTNRDRSTHTAAPCPPPTHSAASPRFSPRSRSARRSVMMSRVPEVPTGWPERDRPAVDVQLLAGRARRPAVSSPSSRRANSSDAIAFWHASTWAANASLISISSKSASLQAGLAEQLVDREHRPEPHPPRVAPGQGVVADVAERPAAGELVGRRQHHRGGAVGDLATVPRRDGAVLAVEDRLQLGERFERLVRPRTGVRRHGRRRRSTPPGRARPRRRRSPRFHAATARWWLVRAN